MDPVLDDLLHLLKLERIEENIFRGESRDIGGAQVFGFRGDCRIKGMSDDVG